MAIEQWMSWEGGVDLVAMTQQGTEMPNVILHLARMVHTPVGSAPSGIVMWQPDNSAAPQLVAFISGDAQVGAYFGPNIFVGMPFENAPVLIAKIEVFTDLPDAVSARVEIPEINMVFESRLTGLGSLEQVNRPATLLPFTQQGVETGASAATLRINGEEIPVTLPEQTMSGAPAACWAPCGIYAK